jgi:hypothetical protein
VNLPRTRGLLSFLVGEPATPSKAMRIRKGLQPRGLLIALLVAVFLAMPVASAFSQDSPASSGQSSPTYQPKFPGDPARSDSEAAALAYMRVVLRAQRRFNKQYGHFATSLTELVHSGSFTKRMVNPDRGDYTANFKGKDDSFVLTMTPKNPDAQHRYFYAEDDDKIHAEENKPADGSSPVVK